MEGIGKDEVPIIKQLENAGIKKNYDGLLSMLSSTSAEYIKHILKPKQSLNIEKTLIRNIVHTDPHLDEYFAELLFRSCLSTNMSNIEFIEQTMYSEDDLGCRQLWPHAAVFGFGDAPLSGKQPPLVLFDEHRQSGDDKNTTCSQIVISYLKKNGQIGNAFSSSIWKLLNEVNTIDMHGNAHSQHLGNIIKILHNVRFLFSIGDLNKDDVRDFLPPLWKRALIDACIVSIVYCLENKIDLTHNPLDMKSELEKSLEGYKEKCLHRGKENNFDGAFQKIKSNYGGQINIFRDALLKNKTELIKDNFGNNIPQLLILSRICFACNQCWGEKISHAIMAHIFEVDFQKQVNFISLKNELESTFSCSNKGATPLGMIQRKILHTIKIKKVIKDAKYRQKMIPGQAPLWIINIRPILSVFSPNQAAFNYINEHNNGCGILFIENTYVGTKALLKGQGILSEDWENLNKAIKKIEPECWYHPPGKNFSLNGNMAHREKPQSMLDMQALCKLAENNIKEAR